MTPEEILTFKQDMDQLKKDQKDLLKWKEDRIHQQITSPIDLVSQEILGKEVGSAPAFPVGSIYIAVVATNPATLLGYGTWTAFGTGRTLVGIDAGQTEFDVVEETGGEKTHTLTTTEMPAHVHGGTFTTNGGGSSNVASGGGFQVGNSSSTGSDGPHNNLQPYIVVYMWKRTV